MMDVGLIDQNNFNFNITNEQQLADMNDWLARLSNNIVVSSQAPAPVNSSYPIQQYPTLENNMYFNNNENDLYVRSQPIVPSQNIESYLGMNYPQQQQPPSGMGIGMTGQRQHYTAVPDLSNQIFNPEVMTAYNFTAGNQPHQAEKTEIEAFKPTKTDLHSEKKNMATLINTFSSAHVEPKKSTTTSKQATKEEQEKNESDTIRDLITSDFSKLSIKDDTLYPTNNSSNKHYLLLKKLTDWVNENYRKQQQQLLK